MLPLTAAVLDLYQTVAGRFALYNVFGSSKHSETAFIMLRKRIQRRSIGISLVVAGGLLMWLAPEESIAGLILLAAAVALEITGLVLEHRAGK